MSCPDDGSKLIQELCRYGPKVIIRSIKPIKKHEEVCIAYTDLLQPKGARFTELWEKYHFLCHCKRCMTSQESYVDQMLGESFVDDSLEDPADVVEQAVDQYMFHGDAEACCEKIEVLLSTSFRSMQSHLQTPNEENVKLLPLHHVALKGYMALASAYKIQTNNAVSSSSGSSLGALKMARSAAAYSLMLAGATHYLFLWEQSLIGNAALFVIDAGELLLALAEQQRNSSKIKFDNYLDVSSLYRELPTILRASDGSFIKQKELNAISTSFLHCTTRICHEIWPFLTAESQPLKNINNPMDFSWLVKGNRPVGDPPSQHYLHGHGLIPCPNNEGDQCMICKYLEDKCLPEENKTVFYLATHCLLYGHFLAAICYSPENAWVTKSK